jgi:hypothetical protein
MDSNQLSKKESDLKQLKELFPDIDSEMIAFFYSEQCCSLEDCTEYLLTFVPQTNSGTTTIPKETPTNNISDELMAKAMQEILGRNEEPSPEAIEKEIQNLRIEKVDTTRDELVAQAIQTLLNRNEEISESNIEKEIRQVQTDVLLAHEIQFGQRQRKPGDSERDEKILKKEQLRLFNEMSKETERPSEIAIGIENFFRDVGEGFKSTVASITEFVEAKLEDKDELVSNREERIKLLGDKDVEMDDINLLNVLTPNLVDLEESFLDSGESLSMF